MVYPDPELLKTFLAVLDSGSLARAAEIVGRTPSAVTSQMQRLAEIAGQPLLEPAGRGRVATPAGEEFAAHARRILELNRTAILSLRGAEAAGTLRLGATEDFAENGLPDQLQAFSRTHARVRLELRIGRSAELAERFASGELDLMLAVRGEPTPDEVAVLRERMIWVGPTGGLSGSADPLPLAVLDGVCAFRAAAVAALARAGRPYWIAAASQSLAGLRTAVSAGLAVTPRSRRWLSPGVAPVPASLDLPDLGEVTYALRLHAEAPRPARTLAEHLASALPIT
jgi:DNA-binding transcriptional LysR family regulator